ncbi:MAG: response regulator transcription factor [Coriobacteriales bacterium]|jgi:DNA-binding response OmpR family regulator|nr:response regulator transcription factor [Coriobacteriales bacterium]
MNILLVEDQQRLAQALLAILREAGYHADAVGDGRSGLDYALSAQETGTPYDAIVLDVMLPVMDGFAVAQELRRRNSSVPVIMLTARDTVHDKVAGLDAGADDYLTKPFQPAELLARLRALTRRSGPVHIEAITLGNTTLDLQSAELSSSGASTRSAEAQTQAPDAATPTPPAPTAAPTSVHLSQREFELCRLFMTNPGQLFTKATLLARVWGLDTEADENSVEAYVSFLRKKLSYLGSDLRVVTMRGMGYRLEDAQGDAHAH